MLTVTKYVSWDAMQLGLRGGILGSSLAPDGSGKSPLILTSGIQGLNGLTLTFTNPVGTVTFNAPNNWLSFSSIQTQIQNAIAGLTVELINSFYIGIRETTPTTGVVLNAAASTAAGLLGFATSGTVSGTRVYSTGSVNTPWLVNVFEHPGNFCYAVTTTNADPMSVTVTGGVDRTSTGSVTSNQNVAVNTQGSGTCGIQVSGTWTGTLVFEATVDGSTWNAVNAEVPTTGAIATSTTANGVWVVACAGYQQVRVRGNTVGTGSATVFLEVSTATQTVVLGDALPSGNNVIGQVKVTDGTNVTAVKAASTAAVRTDTAAVVSISPNTPWTTVNQSSAASNFVAKASAGMLKDFTVQVLQSLSSQTIYIMVVDATSAVNGAVTLLLPPIEVVHTAGSTDTIAVSNAEVVATTGITIAASSTGGTTLTTVASAITGTARVGA